ncbi:MAG: DUF1810 domain-containing protein [Sphingobacteriaceae bacterium]|nr:MAG: DUF1810 domain-containing protein [Sphingobacteriaceae bacterium]
MDSLQRFVKAQQNDYAIALAEIRAGRKRSHWMWYIFPQVAGLGHSDTARYYAIRDLAEAMAYLAHPVLGKRIIEISRSLLHLPGHNATAIFGSPDDLKLRSSMTLFALVPAADPVFSEVLKKYYDSKKDPATLELLT